MRNQELSRQLQRLRARMARACAATTNDTELRAHWARYFTILAAGFVENAVPLIYEDYIRNSANPSVARFAIAHLERVQNPKAERLIETARYFNPTWAANLQTYLENDGRKEAIDGIMATRHQIAHGQDVGISMVTITDYISKAEVVIEFMEYQVSPQGPPPPP